MGGESAHALVSVKTMDTIAGYSAALKATTDHPGEQITFQIIKPDGGVIKITEKSDEFGVVKTDFLGFHTKSIGEYIVKAFPYRKNPKDFPEASFEVFPDTVSAVHSKVIATEDSVAADGDEYAKIKVQLQDRHGNPIENHFVELISSRSKDRIESASEGMSNEFGEVYFRVTSTEDGISYFSALDKNAGITLEKRAKVVFYQVDKSSSQENTLQTDYFKAGIFGTGNDEENPEEDDEFGPIDHFKIEFPDTVRVDSDSNFLKIIAVDKNGKIAKNYMGKVIISIPDDNGAVLPGNGEYQFTDRDQGTRQFDLALIFSQTGQQRIIVQDFDDGRISQTIKGEKTVDVTDRCSSGDCGTNGPGGNIDYSDIVELNTPTDNYQTANSTIPITGKARPNTNLLIFLDEEENGTVEVGPDGLFLGEINDVSDGEHVLYLQEETGFEEQSKSVQFIIDSTPPRFDEFGIYPNGKIESEDSFTVTVLSEPELNATVRFMGKQETLTEADDQAGKYTITLRAPEQGGKFDLSVTLADILQNSETEVKKIEVVASESALPSPVSVNVKEENGDAKISWEPLKIADDRLTKYRIRAGTNDLFLETTTEVGANKYEATVEGLSAGKKYFFTVSGVDANGNEGERSKVVFLTLSGEDEVTPPQGNTNDPGGENTHPAPIEGNSTVRAFPGSGEVTLEWSEPKKLTAFYDIRFGISSGEYMERFIVSGLDRKVTVPDLVNDIPYYFTVVPLDENAIPNGEVYNEVQVTPSFSGAHKNPVFTPIPQLGSVKKTVENGPEVFFLLIMATSFAFMMFFFHRAFAFFRVAR